MRDIASNFGADLGLAPAVHASATTGPSVDLLGFESAAFVVTTGAIAGSGDFGVKLQESDDGEDYADVAAAQVDSSAPVTLEAESTYKLGYRGFKRHARLALTKASGTSIAASAVVIKGNARSRPVA